MRGRAAGGIIGIALAAYFWHFARGALRAHFAVDDPMNLGFYWRAGLAKSLGDVLLVWRKSYRPMGAAFYLPIYHAFGMNPLPYRIAILALIAANIFLSYRIAMELTKSRAGATLTAVLVTAHASMTTVYYNTSMIYDVLAYFFTAAMLWMYMRARERGGPGWLQAGMVVAAYVAAINSKEIAIVGAGWVLVYEALFGRPRRWTTGLLLVAIGALFTAARVFGPKSLSQSPGYQLEFTAHRFILNAKDYVNDIFYTGFFNKNGKLIAAFALGTLICALARRRALWFTWFLVSTATLPLIFAVQPRNGGSLYLPLLTFALWMSTLATMWFERWSGTRWAWVKDGKVRVFGPPISRQMQWFAAAMVAWVMVPNTWKWWGGYADALLGEQRQTWEVVTQMRDLPRPKPGTRILFLKNPWPDWDVYFISTLVWNDHTIDPQLADHLERPPDPQRFDWVLTFEGDRLRVVKGAEAGSGE